MIDDDIKPPVFTEAMRAGANKCDYRPYNSVRYICKCGVKHSFPRSPAGGRKATCEYKLDDGTIKRVTRHTKSVICPCGVETFKDRKGFRGK